MINMRVYMDHSATTPVDPEVLKAMIPYFTEKFGNASSLHTFGQEAHEALDNSRKLIADRINANYAELIFTSGGTESDNFAIKGVARALKDKGKHIITSAIEHPAILNSCKALEEEGYKVTYLKVDGEGFIDINQLKEEISKNTLLVSIILANNEIGTLQDLEEIGKICKANDVLFHSDAVQGFTKVPIDVQKFNLDLMSLTAHKIHGPKGIGALYISKNVQQTKKIKKLIDGGAHEFTWRAGTENVAGTVGFAKAVEIANEKHVRHMTQLRDKMINRILGEIPDSRANGPEIKTKGDKRLCNNVNVSFKYIEGEAMLFRLDMEGIACSTGSACASKSLDPSHVLQAIGCTHEEGLHGSLRFSLGRGNTEKQVDYVVEKLINVVKILGEMSPLAKQS
ncbi:MAG: cysteine desulfurase [Candidatus Helarchaeota archaeon]|nr:cysteine desulfurase [Candidatus Helarchaeota archaeon]